MAELVNDCPRCGASRTTFDVLSQIRTVKRYDWQNWYEAFCVCRHCHRSTVFVICDAGIDERDYVEKVGGLSKVPGAINDFVRLQGHISLKDSSEVEPPEHLPDDIRSAFEEGATCQAVKCFNAAGTMYRLCIDLATKPLLPLEDVNGLTRNIRRNLGLRLPWLFENGLLPSALQELSTCVKEDGNDGAHAGTLGKEDAEDILDFTTAILERMFTEPTRLALAKERRETRRVKPKGGVG